MPDDELPRPAGLDDGRRTVAGLARAERLPDYLAAVLVERHRDASFTAGEADQFFPIQQRMPGKAPDRGARAEVLLIVARPQHRALLRIETEHVALRADRVNLPVAHQRSHARTRGIAHRVGTIISVLPDELSIRFIEAKHPLIAGDLQCLIL